MSQRTLQLGADQVLQVVSSAAEELEVESTWAMVTDKPIAHWHPHQHEHFEILEGQLTVELGGSVPSVLGPGEILDVPPRTRHRMWSEHPTPTRARWLITPARRTEEMFRRIDRGVSPWTRLGFLWTFRHEFRIGKPR